MAQQRVRPGGKYEIALTQAELDALAQNGEVTVDMDARDRWNKMKDQDIHLLTIKTTSKGN